MWQNSCHLPYGIYKTEQNLSYTVHYIFAWSTQFVQHEHAKIINPRIISYKKDFTTSS